LEKKIETTKNTKVHENQRVGNPGSLILQVKMLLSSSGCPFVLFREFRGYYFRIQDQKTLDLPQSRKGRQGSQRKFSTSQETLE